MQSRAASDEYAKRPHAPLHQNLRPTPARFLYLRLLPSNRRAHTTRQWRHTVRCTPNLNRIAVAATMPSPRHGPECLPRNGDPIRLPHAQTQGTLSPKYAAVLLSPSDPCRQAQKLDHLRNFLQFFDIAQPSSPHPPRINYCGYKLLEYTASRPEGRFVDRRRHRC